MPTSDWTRRIRWVVGAACLTASCALAAGYMALRFVAEAALGLDRDNDEGGELW